MKRIFCIISCCVFSLVVAAQEHEMSTNYIRPTDPLVLEKLDHWQDLKFGLFMHWGTYSQWGVVESWSICPEDEGWTQRRGPYAANYNDYKKAYENLQTTFNPTRFDPAKWAAAAKDAGMKYVVLTTKHHDGFCMFDTKETDYKVTSGKTPFSTSPRSNIAKEVFDAFRKDGFMIGAYFSKPDWHEPNYWWPYFPPKDRNVNYDPKKYPEKWAAFKKFTYNQIQELMTGYGSVDILWLDGGWVRPFSTIDPKIDWQRTIPYDQDIDMAGIAKMGRTYQPGLVVVDRSVGGEFENYVTPEQTIPAKPLAFPWESCITMGGSWSYVPGDTYKPTNELVHMLVRIISRGGNFLLNIGPSPEGDFSDTAYSRLKEIGQWMKVHGEAVYGTIPFAPYEQGNVVYVQSKDKKILYAYVLSNKEGHLELPAQIVVPGITANKKTKVICLDAPALKLKLVNKDGAAILHLPETLANRAASFRYATTFKIIL
ncbi:alpha-L-fucosidase [Flavihumibacter fluvii]|uniref:alpha-L-fucosidase n=1 Tax=Flavihumibacter fluvii TaxID=2838157 RepID=UPI001BDF491B|nr:alpha-L-fucosidase [Flavihumibacter fluvii]ULQ53457.1 alpha-L-fucosidase [Flavihumibacter fluvii]